LNFILMNFVFLGVVINVASRIGGDARLQGLGHDRHVANGTKQSSENA
jgi:hypothetical protein